MDTSDYTKSLDWRGRGWYAPIFVPRMGGGGYAVYKKLCEHWRSQATAQELAESLGRGEPVVLMREEHFVNVIQFGWGSYSNPIDGG